MADYQLYLRDSTLRRVALIEDYADLSLLLSFNAPGGFDFTAPGASLAGLLTPGVGIVIERDGVPLLSGPIDAIRRTWALDADQLILSGPDDTIALADRLALPVPLATPNAAGTAYAAAAHDVRTGPAETVMRDYVNTNAGPGARSERQVPGLRLAPDLARGATITGRARFDALDELLRDLALAGGDLGFRVVQATDAAALEFQVYPTRDLTTTAIFSAEYGNLRAYDYRRGVPPGTYLYVLGGGDLTARAIIEGGDAAAIVAWRRREQAVDARNTADVAELAIQRDKELLDRRADTGLSVTPLDAPGLAFGVDYGLGDRVTVVVDGTPIREVVREVRITLDTQGGETLVPSVLSPGAVAPTVDALYGRLAEMGERLGRLERNK